MKSVQETRFADGTVVTVDFSRRTVEVGAATANGTFSANLVGAQATSWRPTALGGEEVFFLQASPQWGKEVHGEAPICWPWFGGRGALPSHGIARYLSWCMEGGAPGGRALPEKGGASRPGEPVGADRRAARAGGSGAEPPSFVVESTPETRALWPHDFRLRAEFSMPAPDTLEIAVSETNTGDAPFESAFGLHPYFAVADATAATLDGGPVPPPDGSTLVFPADGRPHVLGDPARGRAVAVACDDADAWRLWNPGEPNRYVAPGEWRRFFCLEPTLETPRPLAPGASRTRVVRFRADALSRAD